MNLKPETSSVLDAWMERLASACVIMGKKSQVRTQFEGWLVRLLTPERGETDELYRQVALHGRNLGYEGRPASAALMQVLLLEDTLTALFGLDHPHRAEMREITRIVVDAHAVGASQRQAHAHKKTLIGATPLIHIPGLGPVVFVIGSMDADILDAAMGRVLRECAGQGASRAVVDVSSSQVDHGLLHRTLLGFARSDPGTRYHLTITGLSDPNIDRRALENLGCPLENLRLRARLEDVLAARVNNP